MPSPTFFKKTQKNNGCVENGEENERRRRAFFHVPVRFTS
jgi:hypothetical protein